MSTRATYKIDGVCFYIHYDGYREGAAVYFWNMHHAKDKNPRGGNAEAFLRGNELSEFTKNHTVHGDTEYRYDLTGETLTVWERSGDWGKPKFKKAWSGYWWEFVNAHARMIDGFERLAKLNGRVWTRSQLATKVGKMTAELTEYSAKFPTHIGNINGINADLQRASNALAAYKIEGDAV
jgi:hypothetical protein